GAGVACVLPRQLRGEDRGLRRRRRVFRTPGGRVLQGVHFFFLLLRPPPGFTLFPYTTLFRSLRRPLPRRSGDVPACGRARAVEGDRKSTRLNSSHVKISYAVFCLKKKKSGTSPGSRRSPPL